MANHRRGEIEACLGGQRYTLCLTLGSLAELEAACGAEDLGALASRFASGRVRTDDLIRLIGSGLRGGGHALSDDEVRALPLSGSLVEMAEAVAALLDATFGNAPANPPVPQEA